MKQAFCIDVLSLHSIFPDVTVMNSNASSILSEEALEELNSSVSQKTKADVVNPSLIITTYNWPQALRLSVTSVWSQTVLPKEIIIADDGSKEDTRETIDQLCKHSPIPIIHVWQPDEGFQLSKIRNRGIAAASSEYIIITDGDCILEPHFIEDHIYYAQPGRGVCGSRVKLVSSASAKILKTGNFVKPFFLSPAIRFGYNLSAFRNRWLSNRFVYEVGKHQTNAKFHGCNMAFWKSDAIRINGFDEEYTSWGWEDCDFGLRLRRSGAMIKYIRFGAFHYHLYHLTKSNSNAVTGDLYKRCVEQNRVRAEKGLDQYL